MELQRAYTDLGPHPASSLPTLRPWNRGELTRPGRREGTARIRREWDSSRRQSQQQQQQPRGSDHAWLREYARYMQKRKYHNHSDNRPEATQRRMHLEKSVLRDILRAEVFKRNVPERLPYVTHVRAVTAPPATPMTSLTASPVTLFQRASGRVQHSMEREKRPMHFIDKEWASEKVSWVRFHTTLSESHKRSWIE